MMARVSDLTHLKFDEPYIAKAFLAVRSMLALSLEPWMDFVQLATISGGRFSRARSSRKPATTAGKEARDGTNQ